MKSPDGRCSFESFEDSRPVLTRLAPDMMVTSTFLGDSAIFVMKPGGLLFVSLCSDEPGANSDLRALRAAF